MNVAGWTNSALHHLRADGLLLETDPRLPSVTSIVAGEPIHGSWWGNPAARGTYLVLLALEDHADALRTKLVDGKVTYIHRWLWSAFLGTALAREEWQLRALSPAARWLLNETGVHGELRLDMVTPPPDVPRKALLDGARQLERRLLVHGGEMHTERGAHARVLASWERWQAGLEQPVVPLTAEDGRTQLAAKLAELNAACGASARVPWQQQEAVRRARGLP